MEDQVAPLIEVQQRSEQQIAALIEAQWRMARQLTTVMADVKGFVLALRCPRRGQRGGGNIVHRAWTGQDKHIERLRCTQCGQEFSTRRGTLLEATKLSEATVEQWLKCQRWGVCDAGTADICGVDLKTVYRFQKVAARRVQGHHEQVTQDLRVEGVQLDEMHATRRRRRVEWRHTAMAMGRVFVLWVQWGPRTQWSYRDYLWYPVHPDPLGRQLMQQRVKELLTPALNNG